MRRALILVLGLMALGLMIAFTAVLVSRAAYRVGFQDGKVALIKDPSECGVWRRFYTKRVESEHVSPWYTPEELGIVLIFNDYLNYYDVYIISGQEDKALAWMNKTITGSPDPYNRKCLNIKYDDQFYEIWWDLCGDYGLPESLRIVETSILLVVIWSIFAAAVYLSHARFTEVYFN